MRSQSVVQRIKLDPETRTTLQDAFNMETNTVNTAACDVALRQTVLPMFRELLGSEKLTFRKFKVNAVHTNRYYNDDWHIDRYWCDGRGTNDKQAAVYRADEQLENHSAVIYLDTAHFEFVEGGEQKTVDLAPGDAIVFPSTVIHRAKLVPEDRVRRAIVIFDLCDAEQPSYDRVIIKCPRMMHWPIPHYLGINIKSYVMPRLLAKHIYSWRFLPSWCRAKRSRGSLVSWEISTEATRPGPAHNIGTSVYPERNSPPTEQLVDKQSLPMYMLALLDAALLGWYSTK